MDIFVNHTNFAIFCRASEATRKCASTWCRWIVASLELFFSTESNYSWSWSMWTEVVTFLIQRIARNTSVVTIDSGCSSRLVIVSKARIFQNKWLDLRFTVYCVVDVEDCRAYATLLMPLVIDDHSEWCLLIIAAKLQILVRGFLNILLVVALRSFCEVIGNFRCRKSHSV